MVSLTNKKLCPYYQKNRGQSKACREHDNHLLSAGDIKRKKIVCPVCKRRLWGWVAMRLDCDKPLYLVPKHKRKKWWKKKGE